MEENAKHECQLIADELSNHLNSSQTKTRIFQWSSGTCVLLKSLKIKR